MIERIFYRLDLLTRRERLLVMTLIWIALPLAAGIGVIVPLVEARKTSQVNVANAEALHQWVLSQAADLPPGALQTQIKADENTGPIGISQIEQTLKLAGLRQRIVKLANRSGNGVEIGFDPVPFEQLTRWLESVRRSWGYSISEFRVERRDVQGHVIANIVLEARQ